MELWIRSQDKKKLVKVDELKMETVKEGNTFIYSHETDLGTYETKERALEVLDEIQEAQLGNYYYSFPSNVKVSNNENTIVYEMPKE